MALTARQRAKLPRSAFAYPAKRAYPVPTRLQAARAGISESQRQRTLRSALSYSARSGTSGSYRHVSRVVGRRSAGTVQGRQGRARVQPSRARRAR
jgi:hypothetical protein